MFVSTILEKKSKHSFINILKLEIEWNLKKTKLTSKLELKLEKNSNSTTFAQNKRRGTIPI